MVKRTNPYSFQESAGNRIIAQELEKNRRIKTYFSENDKTPNTDGYFEILGDGGVPVRRFVVQIKSTESDQKIQKLEQGKYVSDAAFFQYIQNKTDSNPAMFFVIDVENAKTYFKHLSPEYLQSLYLRENQETVTVCFDSNEMLDEEKFYELCADICKGEQLSFTSAGIISGKEFPYSVRGGPIALNRDRMNSFGVIKSIRKLKDGLWVNWKTGILADDAETALNGTVQSDGIAMPSADAGTLPMRFTPDKIRLLSVLVQGEGAVVCWDELYRRGIVIEEQLEKLRQARDSAFPEVRVPFTEVESERYGQEAAVIMKAALESAGEMKDEDKAELERIVREGIGAIRRLCAKAPALADIIEPAENGKGFRILLSGTGIQSAKGHFPAIDEAEDEGEAKAAEEEWDALTATVSNGYCDAGGWLRRHYAEVCGSFEGHISNAGGNIKDESKVFGRYRMAEAYMNAYAVAGGRDGAAAMLDYVEQWYRETRAVLSARGRGDYEDAAKRVLVLHGHPGDGKTTFCKKAVYAHCFEGWLADVPNVLRISLNKNDNGGIIKDGKLNLPGALGIFRKSTGQFLFCAPHKLEEGTLVIFDGYDELAGDLAGDADANSFAEFYKCVHDYAGNRKWYAVITSRTMCIKRELEEKEDFRDRTVASFAPMTALQQDLMIDRMIELDERWGRQSDLRIYRKEELPKLRAEGRLNKFLEIPILFRMIVAVRFKDVGAAATEAELYGRLFHSLMNYKGRKDKAVGEFLKYYEDIAARIFNHNKDTCPLDERDDGKKELIYLFFTKNEANAGENETDKEESGRKKRGRKTGRAKREGQLGFLHGSFRQYFLARYLVSRIRKVGMGSRDDFLDFMRNLRARLIEEPLVWKFVYELTWLNGTDKDPFKDVTADEPVTMGDIRTVREHLNDEMTYADCMAEMAEPAAGSDAERGRWLAAENAVFNLLGALSTAEKACAEDGEETDSYHKYLNIIRLLRRGYYHGIYLEGTDFADCNLRRADLAEARMAGACLTNANLKEASLTKADLAGADMRDANLIGANLSGAVLTRGNFLGADLTNADLAGADLRNASFDETAACESETEQESESPAGRENTSLAGARLSHAKMGGAHLEKVNLRGASLADADLVVAFLTGADLRGADLAGADLTDAILLRADLAGADLRGAWLIGADLSGAHLEGAYLDGAVLKGALLPDAHLERAHLVGAELCEADVSGAHFEGASLNAAYLGAVVPDCPESFNDDLLRPAVLSGAFLAGADINGAYLSDSQYRYAVETGAVGQPLRLFGGGIQLAGSITGRMGEKDRGSQKAPSLGSGMGQIAFGRYRQGKNGEVLPLRWRVLKTNPAENKVLLITEKLIDCRAYHEQWTSIRWEECDLREWLNGDFFREAFTGEERQRIAVTPNLNPDNRRYRTRGGNPTDDRVFLIGIEEAESLFHSNRDRSSAITPYAKEQYRRNGYGSDPSGWWWLRSPGHSGGSAACVAPGGGVDVLGGGVLRDYVFVRPALWLNL